MQGKRFGIIMLFGIIIKVCYSVLTRYN